MPQHGGNGAPWDIFIDGMSTLAEVIEWLDAHLDESVAETYKDQPLAQDWARVAKVTEEAGEAIDALIGLTGQNPRKGKYGSLEHLLEELADVALTGIYAIQHFTKDAESSLAIVVSRAQHHRERVAHLGRAEGGSDAHD